MSQISVTIVTVISTNEEKMDNFSDNLKPYFPMMNGDYGNSQINIRDRVDLKSVYSQRWMKITSWYVIIKSIFLVKVLLLFTLQRITNTKV